MNDFVGADLVRDRLRGNSGRGQGSAPEKSGRYAMSRFQPGPGWRDGLDPDAAWKPSASRDAMRLRAWLNRLVQEPRFAAAARALAVRHAGETPARAADRVVDRIEAVFNFPGAR